MHPCDLHALAGLITGAGIGVPVGALLALCAVSHHKALPRQSVARRRSDGLWAVLLRHYFQD